MPSPKNCDCDACTLGGANPLGFPQTGKTRVEHKRREAAQRLETATLVATLSQREDYTAEDPLWRGWPGSLESNIGDYAGEYTNDHFETTAFNIGHSTIVQLAEKVDARINAFTLSHSLNFNFPPTSSTTAYPTLDEKAGVAALLSSWNAGPASLSSNHLDNAPVLLHVAFLEEALRSAAVAGLSCKQQVDDMVNLELFRLESHRQREWEKAQRSCPDFRIHCGSAEWKIYNTDDNFRPLRAERPVVVLGLFLVIVLNLVHHLVRSGCRLALQFLKTFMELSFHEVQGPSLTAEAQALVDRFPVDLQTARKLFELEPVTDVYACCPECFALYLPESEHPVNSDAGSLQQGVEQDIISWGAEFPFHDDSTPATKLSTEKRYPLECRYRDLPNAPDCPPCGTRLLRSNERSQKPKDHRTAHQHSDGNFRPIRTYSHQSMKAWLSRLISRRGMEEIMDKAWEPVRNSKGKAPEVLNDIWDASEVREFLGPGPEDQRKPFHFNPDNEGRYLFSLFIDWFNPLGNKQAGKSMSSGVIFMACLNLPLNIRYKRENIYLVGVMPGPKMPRIQQVNRFLEILVKELLEFWEPGVFFSKTMLYPNGRLFRCAVIPLICDLGAVKKVAGQASHSHTFFCSFCKLKKQNINNVDPATWPPRTCDDVILEAEQWQHALSEQVRKKTFKQSGIRYTPLHKLPYWKPTRYVVVETMHNLFLGLFQRHCRHVFGIDIKGVSDLYEEPPEEATEEEKHYGRRLLEEGYSPEGMKKKLKLRILQCLYEEVFKQPPAKKTKIQLANELADHVSGIGPRNATESPIVPKPKPNNVLDKIVLAQVQADIARTTLPSWIGRAPPDIGNPGHGKLSADEWRTLCTVHLPITLIRLWSRFDAPESRKKMLNNFLDLVAAVLHGTPRALTEQRIKIYDRLILRYMKGLLETFKDITLVPNQHYALHLGSVLRRLGPTHAYWAFPFERYIGLMERIRTNHKPGEMEMTFMQTYCMGSNLRGLLTSDMLPSAISNLRAVIDIALGQDSRGSLMSDLMIFGSDVEPRVEFDDRKQKLLSSTSYQCLLNRICNDDKLSEGTQFVSHIASSRQTHVALNPYCQPLDHTMLKGLRYSNSQSAAGIGDSFILAKRRSEHTNGLMMAQIQSLFVHRRFSKECGYRDQVFASIRRFENLSLEDQKHDPFRKYKHLRMFLVYSEPVAEETVIPLSDIISHFATCPVDDENLSRPCVVGVSLQR